MMTEKIQALKANVGGFWTWYKSRKMAWVGTGVILLIIILIVTGGGKDASGTTATVERKDLADTVVLSGRTQSASAVELGFADQGRVASVLVREGDRVYKGQILATLESSDLYAELKNAQAALVIAKAGVTTSTDNVEKVTREQNALVENTRRALLSNDLAAVPKSTTVSVTPPVITGSYNGPEGEYVIRVLGSSGISAQSFTVSGLEEGGTNTAVPNQSVPLGTRGLFIQFAESGQYPYTEWTVSIPNKRSSTYSTYYNAYLAALSARDLAIANAQSALGTTSSDQSVSIARVEQAQANVDSIFSRINKRRIVASFEGVVANVGLKPGQSTSSVSSSDLETANANKITLISENDYEVVLKVPEISVAKLSVGQVVDVILDAYGKEIVFAGEITSINPAETIVEGVPVYETHVLFSEADERIRSGMTATANIVSATREQVLAIPVSMVLNDKDGMYVNVLVEEDKTERRAVTTGLRSSDSLIEILSGLSEGERVSSEPLN